MTQHPNMALADELMAAADEQDRLANQFKGCSWMGSEPPGSYNRRQASLLRTAAIALIQQQVSPLRGKSRAASRRTTQEPTLP